MKKKLFLFIGVPLGIMFLFIGIGGAYLVTKARGDEEVMVDIDKHFDSLPRKSRLKRARLKARKAEQQKVVSTNLEQPVPVTQEGDPKQNGAENKPGSPKRGISKKQAKQRSEQLIEKTPYAEDIIRIAPSTYVVDAELFSKAQKNPKQFIGTASASMVQKNGENVGFQLAGIRSGTAAFALGLRNGDILIAVNGQKLTSADQALVALATIQMNKKFRVDVKRKNGKQSLYYLVE